MKYWFAAFFILMLAACNGPSQETKQEEVETEMEDEEIVAAPSFSQTFPELVEFIRSQDSTFSPEQFVSGDMLTKDSAVSQPVEPGTFDDFSHYLVYNADSSLALDLVSYNFIVSNKKGKQQFDFAGPDTEIALIDIKQNTRKRILFLGSAGLVLDGKWDKDGNIILAGAQDAGDGKLHPVMWKYYPVSSEIEVFSYPGTIKANASEYYDKKYTPLIKTSPAV